MTQTLENIPNARQHLQSYYELLNPGGTIFVRSFSVVPGEDGWVSCHPALEPFSQIGTAFMASMNDGLNVGAEVANWLSQLEAVQVKQFKVRLGIGGESSRAYDVTQCSPHYA